MDTLDIKSMKSYININLFGSNSLQGGSDIANSYHELINVARGKNTTQSSVLKTYGANLAVDGDIRTFSHTSDGNAWIQIDLQASYYVHSINILNRWCSDQNDHLGCLCRLSNAKLFLLETDGAIVETRDFGNTCGVSKVVEEFDDSCLFENAVSEVAFILSSWMINHLNMFETNQWTSHPISVHVFLLLRELRLNLPLESRYNFLKFK